MEKRATVNFLHQKSSKALYLAFHTWTLSHVMHNQSVPIFGPPSDCKYDAVRFMRKYNIGLQSDSYFTMTMHPTSLTDSAAVYANM